MLNLALPKFSILKVKVVVIILFSSESAAMTASILLIRGVLDDEKEGGSDWIGSFFLWNHMARCLHSVLVC